MIQNLRPNGAEASVAASGCSQPQINMGNPQMRLASTFAAAVALASLAGAAHAGPLRPYVGIVGGHHGFDGPAKGGYVVDGLAGVDYDLGHRIFVGAEANAGKGFNAIDAEYGAVGTLGFRHDLAGTWKIFAKAGYQRVEFKGPRSDGSFLTGIGVDYAFIPSRPGFALRFNADTMDFHSTRLTGGVVLRFNSF